MDGKANGFFEVRLGYIAFPAKQGQLSWFFGKITAESAGVEGGKMDEACMAEELDNPWGGILAWISPICHS